MRLASGEPRWLLAAAGWLLAAAGWLLAAAGRLLAAAGWLLAAAGWLLAAAGRALESCCEASARGRRGALEHRQVPPHASHEPARRAELPEEAPRAEVTGAAAASGATCRPARWFPSRLT